VVVRQDFSENFGFPCQSTFHLLLHNHLHFHPRLAQEARRVRSANSLTNQNLKKNSYSRRLPTAAPRVQTRVWSGLVMWDFVMDKSGAGAGFLRELRVSPAPIYITSASPHSSSLSPEAGTRGQEGPQCQ
jgi:hypothetical protein